MACAIPMKMGGPEIQLFPGRWEGYETPAQRYQQTVASTG
jgi:hypothetical protein